MHILLIGANGQVGHDLRRQLPLLGEVTSLGRYQLDLTRSDQIRAVIAAHAPDIIINAAAYTSVDKAENEVSLATLINGIAPKVIAESAEQLGAMLVHISTDYVFDGQGYRPYQEDHPTHPLNAYGLSKQMG